MKQKQFKLITKMTNQNFIIRNIKCYDIDNYCVGNLRLGKSK